MEQRAIIMGATSGIGQEVARQLTAKGWLVGIAGRRTERLEALENECERIVCHKTIDVNQEDAPTLLVSLIKQLGGMDLYFHSSGIGWQNDTLDIEKELKTINTNGLGFSRMVITAFNWFAQAKGGHIACITSIAGTKGLGAAPAYSATKRFQSHYLESLTQLAHIRHLNIRITDIRPGFVSTDLIAGSHYPLQMRTEDVARKIVKAIEREKEVEVIDGKYRLLVALWKLIPRNIWTRLHITQG